MMSDPYASLTTFERSYDEEGVGVSADESPEMAHMLGSKRIQKFLENEDMKGLRKFGREHGFIDDNLRQTIWPRVSKTEAEKAIPDPSDEELKNLQDYSQICLDISRTYLYDLVEDDKKKYRHQLQNLLAKIFIRNPDFHYHQGYVSFCKVFLIAMTMIDDRAFHVVKTVSRTHLLKYLVDNEDKVYEQDLENQSALLKRILEGENPELKKFLDAANFHIHMLQSWIATWFALSIKGYNVIVKLFDLFIVSDPLMPLYLSAAIMLYKNKEILQLDCEDGPLISFINRSWNENEKNFPFKEVILKARRLMMKYPPEGSSTDSVPTTAPDSTSPEPPSSVPKSQSEGSKKPTTQDKKVSDSVKEELFQIKPKSAPSSTKPGIASTNIPDSKSQAVTSGKPTVPVTAAREEPRISRREQIPQIGKRRAPSSIRRSDPLGHSIKEALLIAIGVLILAYLYYILFSD